MEKENWKVYLWEEGWCNEGKNKQRDKKCIRRNPSFNDWSNAFMERHHDIKMFHALISSNTQRTLHSAHYSLLSSPLHGWTNSKMKSGKLGILVLLVLFSSSTCSAWFGSKHKSSSGRSSFRPDEASSSSSSSSSSPYILNRFRAGSSVVFPVHGNVYPVGYVKGPSFFLNLLFVLQLIHFMPFFLLSPVLFIPFLACLF